MACHQDLTWQATLNTCQNLDCPRKYTVQGGDLHMSEQIEEQSTKGALAAITAGVLVIIAGFLVYNYFSKVGKLPEGENNKTEEVTLEEEEVPSEEVAGTNGGTGTTETGTLGTGGATGETTSWVAIDYQKDQITGKKHTVKWGDTLWEIAEARYGTGFDYGKIVEANKDAIGFLANGTQALIEPGQVLKLP